MVCIGRSTSNLIWTGAPDNWFDIIGRIRAAASPHLSTRGLREASPRALFERDHAPRPRHREDLYSMGRLAPGHGQRTMPAAGGATPPGGSSAIAQRPRIACRQGWPSIAL